MEPGKKSMPYKVDFQRLTLGAALIGCLQVHQHASSPALPESTVASCVLVNTLTYGNVWFPLFVPVQEQH